MQINAAGTWGATGYNRALPRPEYSPLDDRGTAPAEGTNSGDIVAAHTVPAQVKGTCRPSGLCGQAVRPVYSMFTGGERIHSLAAYSLAHGVSARRLVQGIPARKTRADAMTVQ